MTHASPSQTSIFGRSMSPGGETSRRALDVAWIVRITALAVVAMSMSACVSVRTSHGYVLERGETELSAREGVDTKESVLAKYGEPSMRATFDDDAWYYMASRDAARAFFRPRTTDQQVVAFRFNENGVVQEVENLTLENSVVVNLANKTTPTRGKELSFWEQLLGNVGRLPTAGAGGAPGGP